MERAADLTAFGETVVFLDCFNDLPDPRQAGKVIYPLPEVLLLCLLAVLAGAETFVDIARFGEKKIELLRRFRPFRHGTPAHDHLGDILAVLDAEQFPALLRGLGGGADRDAPGGRRHRRQDAAPLRRKEGRPGGGPHGLGLRRASAPRARPGQGGGQIERDRRHPQAAPWRSRAPSSPSTRSAASATSPRKSSPRR